MSIYICGGSDPPNVNDETLEPASVRAPGSSGWCPLSRCRRDRGRRGEPQLGGRRVGREVRYTLTDHHVAHIAGDALVHAGEHHEPGPPVTTDVHHHADNDHTPDHTPERTMT